MHHKPFHVQDVQLSNCFFFSLIYKLSELFELLFENCFSSGGGGGGFIGVQLSPSSHTRSPGPPRNLHLHCTSCNSSHRTLDPPQFRAGPVRVFTQKVIIQSVVLKVMMLHKSFLCNHVFIDCLVQLRYRLLKAGSHV